MSTSKAICFVILKNGKKISDAEKKQGLRQGLAKRMELAVQYTEPFYERRIAIQV